MSEQAHSPYRMYWVTWGILLVITVAMLASEKFHLPRALVVVYLLAFMLVKAAMIGGNFMHMRYEHKRMAIMVAAGILVTSMVLLAFITPEAFNVVTKSTP